MDRLHAAQIADAVNSGQTSALAVVEDVIARLAEYDEVQPQAWISRAEAETLRARARDIDAQVKAGTHLPLAGVPFAVKDNIDAIGFDTTAGCPDYAYAATSNATVVQKALDAGAILVGKTNLDQFATGLNGSRSPYGAPRCVFNRAYVSGGSSSGSAVTTAAGLVAFAFGTDTAGSGRVPAAFNHLTGYKPTKGRWSTTGLVPACRTLDCISVFTEDPKDAALVDSVVGGYDAKDEYSRDLPPVARPVRRIGVASQLNWCGDIHSEYLYARALERLIGMGFEVVEIDLAPLSAAAALLYSGPWVAERTAAIADFLKASPASIDSTVRQIVEGGLTVTGVETFDGHYKLAGYKRYAEELWDDIDILMLPTAPTIYRVKEMQASPLALNANLGLYTNFVNLLDMAAVAVPAGFRPNGTGFGITFIGSAATDNALLDFASQWNGHNAYARPDYDLTQESRMDTIKLSVVGAHLEGMPLHWQLTSRDAKFIEKTTTAATYKLYAMADTVPPKPALIHDNSGTGIEVEIYELSVAAFGSFVAEVPPPLAIGTVTLKSGEQVKGFVAEPRAVVGATDITDLGGWRAYIASKL
ncbi:allophanate hydrolase [Asticcacaulis excentricus]|uniref:Allophanate hydrolase n=1 Tax=Asticcacaulis excentricus (strain ATCC 15261 / DSM 4724 / KCTC 12464 / NCIMB 9791 / VKM B-1370 / CB 48) TaxID=573065 RepID=E8RVC4_ASTEC|nr:allophanate hydrolase [Asticcacaulis excentricus]ADU15265.1 allophanate hydrolase [Asticcacaulis excentricus CB 48]